MLNQKDIVFAVIMTFFVLIGLVCLAVMLGWVKADGTLRKLAIGGFATEVIATAIGFAKALFAPVPLWVTLLPPPSVKPEDLKLVRGEYHYYVYGNGGTTRTIKRVGIDISLEVGGWQAKLPQDVLDKPIKLFFTDESKRTWAVSQFYPSHLSQKLESSVAENGDSDGSKSSLRALLVPDAYAEGVNASSASRGALSQGLHVKVSNYARPTSAVQSGRSYYDWRVFIDEPSQVLATIRQVSYLLHQTFPNPLRLRNDPRTKFALDASGWGVFDLAVTVSYTDGKEEHGSYSLRFDVPAPPPSEAVDSMWQHFAPTAADYTWPDSRGEMCPAVGSGAAGVDLQSNLLKNRTDVPSAYHDVSWSALRDLPVQGSWAISHAGLGRTGSDLVFSYQSLPIRVAAFISKSKAEGREAANCESNLPSRVDWVLDLSAQRDAPQGMAVVAEVTPRIRTGHPRWTLDQLKHISTAGDSVRVSGWLLFDGAHGNQMSQFRGPGDTLQKSRVTLWEIHPVTKIEVWHNGSWTDLDAISR